MTMSQPPHLCRRPQGPGRRGPSCTRCAHGATRTSSRRSHAELELTEQAAVRRFFAEEHIDQVYLAAARVGGIHANHTYPAQFIYDNLMVQANVAHEAWRHGVGKLLFLGSSCIYPRLAQQPIREEYLMNGALEPTNEPYAVAKIAGIKLCESYNRQYGTDFRSVMPTNLYGPGDNYHPDNSHVIPALMRRFHDAKRSGAAQVVIWGSGQPRREFLYVDDMAAASVHVMELAQPGLRQSYRGHAFAHQHRQWRRHHDCRTGAPDRRRRGVRRRHRVRYQQARWHAAQTARRVAPGEAGLARQHAAADRLAPRVCSLPRKPLATCGGHHAQATDRDLVPGRAACRVQPEGIGVDTGPGVGQREWG